MTVSDCVPMDPVDLPTTGQRPNPNTVNPARWMLILLLGALILPVQSAQGQQGVSGWIGYPDLEHGLYLRMMDESLELLEARHQRLASFESEAQWRVYRQEIREKLDQAIGPMPERTDLNARTVGDLHRDDFRIEKVIYESRPGYHVTAALYLPEGRPGPHPAVIYASGHTSDGFRSGTYQTVAMNLVRRGFAVLAFDPVGQGERHQYLDESGEATRLGGPTREHSYAGAQMLLSGDSMVRSMIWDGIRSVDYLLSRDDIDPDRIGMTGRSGGGTQTALVAAMDDRIRAAAPENYITTLSWLFRSLGPQDAEQNIPGGVALGLDHGDLLLARAPKPTLLIATTRDFFSIQGARETSAEVRRAWEAMGSPDHYDHIEDDHGHGSTPANRERMVRFFQTHLDNPGPSGDLDVEPFPADELRWTETGQVRSSLEGVSIFDLQLQETRTAMQALAASRARPGHPDRVRQAARERSGYRTPGVSPGVVFTGRTNHEGYGVETGWVPGGDGRPIPWTLYRPEGEAKGVLLWLDPRGKAAASSGQSPLTEWVRQGWLVVAADLPGVGELSREPGGDSIIGNVSYNLLFSALHNGRSLVGIRAGDLSRVLHAIHAEEAAASRGVTLLAQGGLGVEALHGTLFSGLVHRLVLVDALYSWNSLASTEDYDPGWSYTIVPSALRSYDLPDLAVETGVPQLWVQPRDGAGDPISEGRFQRAFRTLTAGNVTDRLPDGIEMQEQPDWTAILNWIETTEAP